MRGLHPRRETPPPPTILRIVCTLSHKGLTWAHIFCEVIAINDGVEAIEPVSHGNGPSRFVAILSGPAAETGDGPAGPGQAVGRMRVLLLGRAPLQFRLQRMQNL